MSTYQHHAFDTTGSSPLFDWTTPAPGAPSAGTRTAEDAASPPEGARVGATRPEARETTVALPDAAPGAPLDHGDTGAKPQAPWLFATLAFGLPVALLILWAWLGG
ncbi:MAG: hypothetical protein ABIO70_00015 [Pseudomonadota bacterium]